MVTETNTSNEMLVRYFQKTTSNSTPAKNGTTLQRTFFNHWVDNAVTKDMSKRPWKDLIANGQNATTSLSGTEVVLHKTPGYYSQTWTRRTNDSDAKRPIITETIYLDLMDLSPPAHSVGSSFAEADSKARTTFVRRCNEQIQAYKGLQYLGEAREAIRMLQSNTDRLAGRTNKYLDQVMRDLSGIKRTKLPKKFRRVDRLGDLLDRANRAVTQRYLEYTFGISPLIRDTEEAAITLAKIHDHENHDDFRMISAVGKATGAVFSSSAGTSVGTYLRLYHTVETKTVSAVIYRGVVGTTLDSLSEVNKFLGLDLSDFAPTVWEILPWSFVADYFTNISEIVDAASFARGRLRWCSRTTVTETTSQIANVVPRTDYALTAYPTILPVHLGTSFTPPTASFVKKDVSRVPVYTGSLIPDFTWSLPKPKQMLNVLALGASFKTTRKFITNFLTK